MTAPMPYLVVDMRTWERGRFPTAWDVAMYLWGRDLTQYAVYKHGTRVDWLGGCRADIERTLERA